MSSKRRLRRNQCTRKEKYEFGQAVSVAKSMRRNRKMVRAYKCHFCGGWHVGRPDRDTARNLRNGHQVKK